MIIERTTIDIEKKIHCRQKKVVDGYFDGRTQANVRNKTRGSSEYESSSSMKASIQNLIQCEAVVFENDELEFRDMSELKALLPLLAYQDSNSDVAIIFSDF